MPNYNWSNRLAATANILGLRVDRASADCQGAADTPIFNILGGRVFVTQILGEVADVAIAAGGNNFKLQSNPTAAGTTTDLCANLDIDADPIGTMYSITGIPGDALVRGEEGAVQGMTVKGVVVPVGAIETVSAGNVAGQMKWSLWYIPLDDGAYVEAVAV